MKRSTRSQAACPGLQTDQIYVLTYNHDSFDALYGSRIERTPLPESQRKVNRDPNVPEGVEDAVQGEDRPLTPTAYPAPAAPLAPMAGYIPVSAWADLDLDDETLRAHQRDYKSGDILVVLKTDEGQEYRPNMPAKK